MSKKNFASKRAYQRHMARSQRKLEIKQTKGKAMSDKKLTKEELDQEYTQLCAQLGDIEVKRDVLAMQENSVKQQIRAMQKQAHEQQIAEMQQEPKAEEVANAQA